MQTSTRRHIAALWEEFWRAGMCDPTAILEQILYLMFLRHLEHHPRSASDSSLTAQLARQFQQFRPDGAVLSWDACSVPEQVARFDLYNEQVLPWLRCIGGHGASYARHMKNVRFPVPTAAALAAILQRLDKLPNPVARHGTAAFDFVTDRLAGMRGRCVTPEPRELARHMAALVAPVPGDVICSPGCGTGALLVAAAQSVVRRFPHVLTDAAAREHYHHRMFSAFDDDPLMLRLACMHMLLQGVKNPDIVFSNTTEPYTNCAEGSYTVILAHPVVRASPVRSASAEHGHAIAQSVLHCARMLRRGGRAAVVIPHAVLQGSSDKERAMRRMLLVEQRLDAVIPLSRASTDRQTSILLFTRTDGAAGVANDWRQSARRCTTRSPALRPPRRSARFDPAQQITH